MTGHKRRLSNFVWVAISSTVLLASPHSPACAQANTKSRVDQLIKQLRDSDPKKRATAVTALGEQDRVSDATITQMANLLKDSNDGVNLAAGEAILHLGQKALAALPTFLVLLEDKDPMVRRMTSRVLLCLSINPIPVTVALPGLHLAPPSPKLRGAVGGLLKAAKDPDVGVRENAVETLFRLRSMDRRALTTVIDALSDTEPSVRANTAGVLCNLGLPTPSAIPQLIYLIKDPDPKVRQQACYALTAQKGAMRPFIPQLVVLLQDADSQVRISAAFAVGLLGDDAVPAMDALVHSLSNADPAMREMSGRGLVRIVTSLIDLVRFTSYASDKDLKTALACITSAESIMAGIHEEPYVGWGKELQAAHQILESESQRRETALKK